MLLSAFIVAASAQSPTSPINGKYNCNRYQGFTLPVKETGVKYPSTLTIAVDEGAETASLTIGGLKIGIYELTDVTLKNLRVERDADGYRLKQTAPESLDVPFKGSGLVANMQFALTDCKIALPSRQLTSRLTATFNGNPVYMLFKSKSTETGISNVKTTARGTGIAYDLQGRRVTDSYRGIVIVDGVKRVR